MTCVLELTPKSSSHRYASQYFNLPKNHTPVIKDATAFVYDSQERRQNHEKYDYIIHDVFTGGAEPVELFTKEFLEGLSYMLKADGVIAIVSRFRAGICRCSI